MPSRSDAYSWLKILTNSNQKKIRRALAQGVSDHELLDSKKEQHPFSLQVSTQTGQFSKQKSTSSHSCCNCCCCCCCCCSNCCFLFKKRAREGGCQGASGSSDRHPNLRRVTFFLHLFLGILRLLIFSYFVQNWSPNSSQNGVHF